MGSKRMVSANGVTHTWMSYDTWEALGSCLTLIIWPRDQSSCVSSPTCKTAARLTLFVSVNTVRPYTLGTLTWK